MSVAQLVTHAEFVREDLSSIPAKYTLGRDDHL